MDTIVGHSLVTEFAGQIAGSVLAFSGPVAGSTTSATTRQRTPSGRRTA